MTDEMDFDIRSSADRISALIDSNRGNEALALLHQIRNEKPLIVQETLDRYVGANSFFALARLSESGGLDNDPSTALILERLQLASAAPRMPGPIQGGLNTETQSLSQPQIFDIYESMVLARGGPEARIALNENERVILGMRQENSTTESPGQRQTGRGVYNDAFVVLWKDEDGTRHAHQSNRGNTEPTAQYDHHAGSNGRRSFNAGGQERRVLTPTPAMVEVVSPRRIEGSDVNGDGLWDMGRLSEGAYEFLRTTHPTPRGPAHTALRPTPEAVANGRGRVERDTNGDGWFTRADINGTQDLNNSFKFHQGSLNSTDSAGCQTLHPSDYPAFIRAVTANPHQTRWQYVLTSTTPSEGQELQVGGERVGDAAPVRAGPAGAPRMPPAQRHGPQQPGLHPGDDQRGEPGLQHERRDQNPGPAPAPYRPDDPRHPDHTLLLQIRGIVRAREGAGAPDESADERLSRALLPAARGSGMTSVDHLMAHGGKLFLVQGRLHDPANLHASIDTEVAMRTGLEQSDRQLEEVHRRFGAEPAQQQGAHQSQVHSNEALSLRV